MTRARVLIAGLTVASAMTVADAFAQDCPEWLKWACPDNAASNAPAMQRGQQSQRGQIARTNAPSTSATGRRTKQAIRAGAYPATNPKPTPTQAAETQGRAKPTGQVSSVDRSGDQRLASREARRAARSRPALSEQEKEALFQQFLLWRKEQRPDADTSR